MLWSEGKAGSTQHNRDYTSKFVNFSILDKIADPFSKKRLYCLTFHTHKHPLLLVWGFSIACAFTGRVPLTIFEVTKLIPLLLIHALQVDIALPVSWNAFLQGGGAAGQTLPDLMFLHAVEVALYIYSNILFILRNAKCNSSLISVPPPFSLFCYHFYSLMDFYLGALQRRKWMCARLNTKQAFLAVPPVQKQTLPNRVWN